MITVMIYGSIFVARVVCVRACCAVIGVESTEILSLIGKMKSCYHPPLIIIIYILTLIFRRRRVCFFTTHGTYFIRARSSWIVGLTNNNHF